jgi:hypothetical protein
MQCVRSSVLTMYEPRRDPCSSRFKIFLITTPSKILKSIVLQDLKTYVRPIQKLGGETGYGPKNITEAWQPIDAGHIGAMLKAFAKGFLDEWLAKDYKGEVVLEGEQSMVKNWQIWELGKFTAREKRVLMTWVFGNAWTKLTSIEYAHLVRSAFEKTGILQTATGKNDHIITCECLKAATRATYFLILFAIG